MKAEHAEFKQNLKVSLIPIVPEALPVLFMNLPLNRVALLFTLLCDAKDKFNLDRLVFIIEMLLRILSCDGLVRFNMDKFVFTVDNNEDMLFVIS